MSSYNTLPGHTLRDLGVKLYGSGDAPAVLRLISLNAQFFEDGADVDIAAALATGTEISYDDVPVTEPVVEIVAAAAPAKSWTTVKNQTWRDLSVQLYGNTDAVLQLVSLNPQLFNEGGTEVDITNLLWENEEIFYDEEPTLQDKKILAKLNGTIIATSNYGDRIFADEFADEFE